MRINGPSRVLVPLACLVVLTACFSDRPTSFDGDGERTTTYAGTVFAAQDVRTSSAAPDGEETGDTYVYVKVEVENTLQGVTMTYPSGMFFLRRDGDEVSRSDGFLAGELESRLKIEPGEVRIGELVFALTTAVDLDQLTLTIEEQGREPGLIALGGPMPKPPHPAAAEITGDRETVQSSSPWSPDVDVEPLGARTDLDWGSTRSDLGSYFMIIDMRAFGLSRSGGGTNVFGTVFRLEVDGVPRGPWRMEGDCGLIGLGEAKDCQPIFQVPHDAEQLWLVAGESGGQQARYPISLTR